MWTSAAYAQIDYVELHSKDEGKDKESEEYFFPFFRQ